MAKGTDARPRGPGRTTTDRVMNRAPGGTLPTTWALSPTDLTFLWDECPRCFYNKVVLKQPRPRSPFPSVFGLIDRAMKDCYLGQRTEDLVLGAPPGVIEGGDRWVKSLPLFVPGSESSCLIRGRLDALVRCDDDTAAIIDFKTAPPNDDHLEKYRRQLHAYALALEQPSVGPTTPVSGLGLLSFSPERFETTGEEGALWGGLTWTALPLDRTGFLVFLGQVLALLDQPGPPPANLGCPWCQRGSGRRAA
jgi:hypothetical protein